MQTSMVGLVNGVGVLLIISHVQAWITVHLPYSEKRLVKELVSRYVEAGTHGRPIENSSLPVHIGAWVALVHILDMDEYNQVLTTSLNLEYQWKDEYLLWNPLDYGNIHSCFIPSVDMWTPDLIISNALSEAENIDGESMAHVRYNGEVTMMERKVYKTACFIQMHNYPFDTQECHIILRSSTYSSNEMRLHPLVREEGQWDYEEVELLKEYTEANEWKLINSSLHLISDARRNTTLLKYTIVLQRKVVFFTFILILPCVFLSILTLVNFWLPPDSSDKTALGMSIFASFMVLLLVLVDTIPSTASSVPMLGIFYFFNMVMTSLSICLATIVLNVSRRSETKSRVPRWLKIVAIDVAGKMFGLESHIASLKIKKMEAQAEEMRITCKDPTQSASSHEQSTPNTTLLQFSSDSEDTTVSADKNNLPALGGMDKQCHRELHEIKLLLLAMMKANDRKVQRTTEKDDVIKYQDEKALEWKMVALGMDRLFFFIYLLTITVMFIVVLVHFTA